LSKTTPLNNAKAHWKTENISDFILLLQLTNIHADPESESVMELRYRFWC